MPASLKISLVGTGRAATQVGRRLLQRGCRVVQVFGRDAQKTASLAAELIAQPVFEFEKLEPSADLFILAVSDAAIAEVAENLRATCPAAAAIHLSGATDRAAIAQFFGERTAVVWPVHSFSINEKPDWREIPLILETGDDPEAARLFERLAKKLSPKITRASGADRGKLHLAATVANNFSNHLMALVEAFLEKDGLPFDPIRHIFLETAQKIQTASPLNLQTGPASRGDLKTLERHLDILKMEPGLAEVYRVLTDSILKARG